MKNKKYRIKETGVELEVKDDDYSCYRSKSRRLYVEEDFKDLGLTLEEIEPELIERWVTVNKQGVVVGTYMFEDQARRDALDYYRVILLREVEGGE